MIAIVDYGLGNLASVRNALLKVGAEPFITSDPDVISSAEGVILPGVGAARGGMKGLASRGLVNALMETARAGKPLLGHCLGMQLLFDESEENGGTGCLGVLQGKVRRLSGAVKVPHIGWNQVSTNGAEMWNGLARNPYVYFVHSYVCVPRDRRIIAGTTEYGDSFCSAVVQDNIWGVQFHPERSGTAGLRLMSNFVCLAREGTHPAVTAGKK